MKSRFIALQAVKQLVCVFSGHFIDFFDLDNVSDVATLKNRVPLRRQPLPNPLLDQLLLLLIRQLNITVRFKAKRKHVAHLVPNTTLKKHIWQLLSLCIVN